MARHFWGATAQLITDTNTHRLMLLMLLQQQAQLARALNRRDRLATHRQSLGGGGRRGRGRCRRFRRRSVAVATADDARPAGAIRCHRDQNVLAVVAPVRRVCVSAAAAVCLPPGAAVRRQLTDALRCGLRLWLRGLRFCGAVRCGRGGRLRLGVAPGIGANAPSECTHTAAAAEKGGGRAAGRAGQPAHRAAHTPERRVVSACVRSQPPPAR